MEVLQHCFPTNLRRILQELPVSLDDTYKRILKEINNANRVHAYRLLQCLTVARRPLQVEELAELLAFDLSPGGIPKLNTDWRWEDQEVAVLSACSSLVSVVIENGSRIVQFSHFSVKEFLTSDRIASCMDVSQFHIPIEPSHAILAQACLGALLCLEDHTNKDSVWKIPLYQYATEYLVEHVQVGNVELEIKDTMDYFFDMDKPHFSAWARIQFSYDLLTVFMDEGPRDAPPPAAPLYFAAWNGFCGLVERLIIKDPQQINQLGGRYGTPLTASAFGGHFEVAQLLFAHGADINSRSSDNHTPLYFASTMGHVQIVKWLMNHGADVNCQEKSAWTPLHCAAGIGHLEVVRMLLERNAEVNFRSDDGTTPLLCASQSGNPDVFQLLLDHNADMHVHDEKGNTPLHFAAEYGHLEVVQKLLESNAEVNSRNDDGSTPLLRASNPHILRLLLDHNAEIRVCDRNGNTPLHHAAEYGHLEVARMLLERNMEVDSQNENGSTPFLEASQNGHPDIIWLLLDRNADVHIHDNKGNTPLQGAADHGLIEVAQMLLEHNAEVDYCNHHRSTPLLLASEGGHTGVVQLLLGYNADVHACDGDGDTALHCAALGGHPEIARMLLELDLEVNSQNNEGSTPLHRASESWRGEFPGFVQLLLDHGADVQVRNLSGQTASEVARGRNRHKIVRLLSQHNAE